VLEKHLPQNLVRLSNLFLTYLTKIVLVSEELRQPLYMMSASELGETATEVEDSLEQVLELTSKWNAILLLDECDMFLEARSAADIRRNRLVSGEHFTSPINRTTFLFAQPMLTYIHSQSLPKAARILSRRNVPHQQPYQRLRHSL